LLLHRTGLRVLLAIALFGLTGIVVPIARAAADIAYKTEITGTDDPALRTTLQAASQLVELQNRPPPTEAALRRRAENDLDRLRAVLNAAGYYEPELSYRIDDTADPVKVTVEVKPGPPYLLKQVQVVTPDGRTPPLPELQTPAALGLELDKPARSAPVAAAEQRLIRAFMSHGYPLARMTDRHVVIDRATKAMEVSYTLDPGPPAAFGAATITGLERVKEAYVRRRITWKEGQLFDIDKVDATRDALIGSGLFATVQTTPATEVGPDGRIAITIAVTERPPRSIGAGFNYNSSQGVGARAFWEHRNLFGEAERLRTDLQAGQSLVSLAAQYRQPDLFSDSRQDLVGATALEREDVDAFTSSRFRVFGGVERRFGRYITGGAGLQFEQSHIEDDTGTQDFTLFGTPMFVRADATDNLLDPTRGGRGSLAVTPYVSAFGSTLSFVASRLTASAYQPFGAGDGLVLAGFGALGSIQGASRDTLPRDKRLYAGGGGSIRGYGYQKAGPLDAAGNPLGGKSSIEFGTELRIKVTDTIGIVPFVEGGNVYDSTLPHLSGLLFGAGIGVRYYTAFGPIRFDVAVPLDRRSADDPFQIYISLGQAF
jgi:translocation and assembly module TamA